MAETEATFSESWYRIAGQRVWLRPDVIVHRQRFRGERWFVLQNPFSSKYYRVRPETYEFVARLGPEKTVQEVWLECADRFPDDVPGQEGVIQLLAQLYFANLLHYENAADSEQLFRRYQERRQRETSARLLNLMFMRFPLLDPDRFLVRTLPAVKGLIGWTGALGWIAVVGLALKVAADNSSSLWSQREGILAPDNLPLLYAALVGIKTIHEFGHAYFCRRYGGEVHVMGVFLMIFTPVPYVDASSSWSFRSRRQRLAVGAAGMVVEVLVAAFATLIWAKTGPGAVHSLCYNVMFIASVSTVIFNANPLLRYDGYYMLSDWLEIPNLSRRANAELRHLWEYYVFGVQHSRSSVLSRRESAWLVTYGVLSGIYRVVVFAGVLLLIADKFLILGLVMAAVCLVSWVTVPAGKFLSYLAASPTLNRVRARAVGITAGLTAVLLVLLVAVPFPHHFRAPGVVKAEKRTDLVNDVAGRVAEILTPPGSTVALGQPLIRLSSPELSLDLADASARVEEASVRLREALSRSKSDLKPLQSRLDSAAANLAKLRADEASLLLRAPHDGVWVAPHLRDSLGAQLVRGTPIGMVLNPRRFEFVATVLQTDADEVFGSSLQRAGAAPSGAEVRLRGQAANPLSVREWQAVPGGQQRLPSPALGWMAGGKVPVAANRPEEAVEPFFEVHAALAPSSAPILHGHSGEIRFDLPPEPLLPQWWRRLRQLFQKRYQV